MSIRIIIADDHEVVRSGIAALLQGTDIEIIGEAATGKEAVELAAQLVPDVAVLDIRMPDGDGLKALDQIRNAVPQVRAIILSTYDNPTYIARAVAHGASDFILKGAGREQLVAAIRNVAAGEAPSADSLMQRVKRSITRRQEPVHTDIPLTNREMQVLRHVAMGLSNREIGRSLGISIETVKEHVQNILRKIHVSDRTQAAVWAVRKGLV